MEDKDIISSEATKNVYDSVKSRYYNIRKWSQDVEARVSNKDKEHQGLKNLWASQTTHRQ